MRKPTPVPKYTVPPSRFILCFLGVLFVYSTVSAILGDEPVNRKLHYIPHPVAAVCLLGLIITSWKRFDFDEEGFTFSRCEIFRRRVSWSQVSQITITTYGYKRSWLNRINTQHTVMLIVLRSAPSGMPFRRDDDVHEYVRKNRGHVFICERGSYESWEYMDQLDAFLAEVWGKVT